MGLHAIGILCKHGRGTEVSTWWCPMDDEILFPFPDPYPPSPKQCRRNEDTAALELGKRGVRGFELIEGLLIGFSWPKSIQLDVPSCSRSRRKQGAAPWEAHSDAGTTI